jgi:hypothetical protein
MRQMVLWSAAARPLCWSGSFAKSVRLAPTKASERPGHVLWPCRLDPADRLKRTCLGMHGAAPAVRAALGALPSPPASPYIRAGSLRGHD